MMNFDALSLKAFIAENSDFISGATVRKVQQPNRREILLNLWKNGISKKLYLNINPSFFHVCFIESLENRGITIPDAAPMFCMLLRKYIQNSKIVGVFQPFGERILELHFEYKDVLNEKTGLCLAIELMGKYSNIILYNKETGIIIGCAHNVGEEKSKVRELAGTLPYVYPQKLEKNDILQIDFNFFASKIDENSDKTALAFELAADYFYLTVPLVKQILTSLQLQNFSENELKKLFTKLQQTVQLKNISPSISKDGFSLVKLNDFVPENSVNSMIDKYFEQQQISQLLKQKKSKFYSFIDSQIKKYTKQSDLLKEKLLQSEKADIYKIKGDILMMNVNNPVQAKMTLVNPYDNNQIEIELDEQLSMVQNANRYYKLYKKTKTAISYATSQLDEIESQLENFNEERFYLELASTLQEIDEVSSELGFAVQIQNKKAKKLQIKLECQEFCGFKIYLGKNSVQNDFLLSKIASPEDIWFHPLHAHGAHVILKKNNSKESIPDEVMLFCAKLAKRFSKAQNDAKIPIIYTERKYVKKANSKLAFVTYKNETEIYC